MELNLQLTLCYLNNHDFYNGKKLIDWFNINDQQKNFKLWLMDNQNKDLYARYLSAIGWYYMVESKWFLSLKYYTRGKDILTNIKGYESFKYNAYVGLADIYAMLGNVEKAEENIQIIEKMYSNKLLFSIDEVLLFSGKIPLFYIQKKYNAILEQNNKAISIMLNNGISSNDLVLTIPYLIRAKMLNSFSRYQEAYEQAEQVYKMHEAEIIRKKSF